MIRTFWILIAFVVFFACKKGRYDHNKTELTGEQVYTTYCTSCHGNDGKQGTAGAANLVDSKLSSTDAQAIISAGKNNMPAFDKMLSAEELKKVVEYIQQLKQK